VRTAFRHTIVFVKDVRASRTFYEQVLGLGVAGDFGTIVFFEGGLALHDGHDLRRKIFKRVDFADEPEGRRNLEIYLESPQLEECLARVEASGAVIVHPIERQEWGQRVFRFFDPDGHVVEIGEPMQAS
jgi:catechol 2,3-dioxygenase-like lactoylglutathione lyase family enzyme